MITEDSGPGLPTGKQWNLAQGGSGFAPPYVFPNGQMTPFDGDKVSIALAGHEDHPFETEASTVNKYLQSLTKRYPAPAVVFCSRELEAGLTDFVTRGMATSGGAMPSDEALRAKAREILKLDITAADDLVLLEKFKAMMLAKLGSQITGAVGTTALPMEGIIEDPLITTGPEVSPASLNLDLNVSESEMNDILKDMSYEFVDGGDLIIGGNVNMIT